MIRYLLESIRDILATSQEIADYCQQKWGKIHTVFLGYNRENPPTDEFWPAIVIAAISAIEKRNMREVYRITIGVYAGTETIEENVNKITFTGFVNSEEFREKIEEEILKQISTLGKIEISGNTLEDAMLFPFFPSITAFVIENITSMRK